MTGGIVAASEKFDLVIVGCGPAGEKAGAQAAYFGKRVAVIERAGVCTSTLRMTGWGIWRGISCGRDEGWP